MVQRERRRWQNVWYRYLQTIPELVKYQLVTKLALAVVLYALGNASQWAIESAGRVAVTSGDFLFLFTSWQGLLLIVLGLAVLFFYIALELNTKIWYCSQIIRGEDAPVSKALGFGVAGMRRFFNPAGLLVILYVGLIVPIAGFGLSISLTSRIYIPSFITSVITSTPLYLAIYAIVFVGLVVLGILHAFVLHIVLLDRVGVREALTRSRQMVRQNLRSFLVQTLLFNLRCTLAAALLIFVAMVPASVVYASGGPRVLLLFLVLSGAAVSSFASFLLDPFFVLKLTQLYYGYSRGETVTIPARDKRHHPLAMATVVAGVAALSLAATVMDVYYDVLFPPQAETRVIAHRGGGADGPENTVRGVEVAIAEGAYGSETDIQRTSDGHYVINHDPTFERLTGDPRKPSELTLAQVKELRLKESGEPIPTLEEMLDASKGRIVLFVELKGETADRQMADDAVRMVRERQMTDEVVLISLNYDLIDYIESTYPEMQTGFLAWLAYGDTASLHCDYLGLEAESATTSVIESIHNQGKLALVWTPNTVSEQEHFFCSEADAIITDNVAQAADVRAELSKRSDLERLLDELLQGPI